jgi:hypothetical protein
MRVGLLAALLCAAGAASPQAMAGQNSNDHVTVHATLQTSDPYSYGPFQHLRVDSSCAMVRIVVLINHYLRTIVAKQSTNQMDTRRLNEWIHRQRSALAFDGAWHAPIGCLAPAPSLGPFIPVCKRIIASLHNKKDGEIKPRKSAWHCRRVDLDTVWQHGARSLRMT